MGHPPLICGVCLDGRRLLYQEIDDLPLCLRWGLREC